jgi:hypothetical protein
MDAAYGVAVTRSRRSVPMLRPEPSETPATIPDRELGIAALLLLLTVVLSVAILPAFI